MTSGEAGPLSPASPLLDSRYHSVSAQYKLAIVLSLYMCTYMCAIYVLHYICAICAMYVRIYVLHCTCALQCHSWLLPNRQHSQTTACSLLPVVTFRSRHFYMRYTWGVCSVPILSMACWISSRSLGNDRIPRGLQNPPPCRWFGAKLKIPGALDVYRNSTLTALNRLVSVITSSQPV